MPNHNKAWTRLFLLVGNGAGRVHPTKAEQNCCDICTVIRLVVCAVGVVVGLQNMERLGLWQRQQDRQTAGCECVAYLPVTGEIKRKELIQPTSGAAGHDHWGHQIERRGVV